MRLRFSTILAVDESRRDYQNHRSYHQCKMAPWLESAGSRSDLIGQKCVTQVTQSPQAFFWGVNWKGVLGSVVPTIGSPDFPRSAWAVRR